MPKIVYINTVSNIGSTGRIVEYVARVANNNGWDCTVVSGRKSNDSLVSQFKMDSLGWTFFHFLGTRVLDSHGRHSKIPTRKLIKFLIDLDPDVIHLHNLHGYYLDYVGLFEYLRGSRARIVWTLFDCWPFTGHCAYYDFIGCNKWQIECNSCPQISSYPKSCLVDGSRVNFSRKKQSFSGLKNLRILVHSDWLKRQIGQSFLSSYKVNVIPSGICMETFHISSRRSAKYDGIFKDKKVLLGVANAWPERKGLRDFIKLSNLIPNDFKIVLVGVTKDQLKSLPKKTFGIEKTDNVEDLVELYSRSFAFVNLTYEDNFPTTNIEALACGTPVITYDTGGSSESVLGGDNIGYVVPCSDISGIYRSVLDLLKFDEATIRTRCRLHAESKFDSKKVYKKYLDVYNSLIING